MWENKVCTIPYRHAGMLEVPHSPLDPHQEYLPPPSLVSCPVRARLVWERDYTNLQVKMFQACFARIIRVSVIMASSPSGEQSLGQEETEEVRDRANMAP